MNGMGFNFDNPREIQALIRSPDRMASVLATDKPGEDAPAKIFADIVNTQRADTARLAGEHGVDMQPERMTPERAAQVLANILHGGGVELVKIFNDEAVRRDRVLRAALESDDYDEFVAQKRSAMFTADPMTHDEYIEAVENDDEA